MKNKDNKDKNKDLIENTQPIIDIFDLLEKKYKYTFFEEIMTIQTALTTLIMSNAALSIEVRKDIFKKTCDSMLKHVDKLSDIVANTQMKYVKANYDNFLKEMQDKYK